MEQPTTRILAVISAFLFLSTIYLMVQNAILSSGLSATKSSLEKRTVELWEANAEIGRLNGTLIRTRAELALTKNELENTSSELGKAREELNQTRKELDLTRAELGRTASILNETMEEFIRLREEIQEIEASVNSSIQWFKDNSVLPRTMNRFLWDVNTGCVHNNVLSLACTAFRMEREMGFMYKSEYPDKLYSLQEMADNNGGDCEDFALFLKALLNRFRDAGEDFRLEGWTKSGNRYVIYKEGNTNWYVEGDPHRLGSLRELNPYVVCFVTHYTGSEFEGHCIVALSEEVISSAEDLWKLNGSVTFEPQNGEYTGKIGERLQVCMEGDYYCETSLWHIIFVISDDDLYQFTEGEWKSYKLYGNKASELGERIDAIVGR